MEILNSLVALAGLGVAALSVFLVYRARHQTYSRALYDRQLLAASEAIEALIEVNAAVEGFRFRQGVDIIGSDKERRAFKKAVYEPKETLRKAVLRNSAFLPSTVFSELTAYLANIELSLGEMASGEQYVTIGRITQIDRPWDEATATFASAIIAMRDFLGVGPLTPRFRKNEPGEDPLSDPEAKRKVRDLVRLLERQYDTPQNPLLPVD